MIAGSLAHDILARTREPGNAIGPLLGWGAGLMLLGYGLSCLNLITPPNTAAHTGLGSWLVEPPFVPPTHPVNLWTMSQRAGSVTYLTFGAGLSLALYAGFVWAGDVRGFQIGVWRTLGSNALAGYVIHGVACWSFLSLLPRRAPLGNGAAGAVVVFGDLLRLRARPGMETHLLADVRLWRSFAAIRLVISTSLAKDGGRASELECGPESWNDCRA